jgi:3-phenylpropionate/trans-cinnamate dioxygenase ferredoxin reductase subunit
MAEKKYGYVIIGSGLAGTSAVEGIREIDRDGTILLMGNENNMPYDRPPLSKKLWSGKKKLEDIFLHDRSYYERHNAELALGVTAVSLDAAKKTVVTDRGETVHYSKLLLATGGYPRRLELPGGDLEGICYFRTIDDYKKIRETASAGKKAVIIGGGFIGSEMAASLNMNGVDVAMVFPEDYLVQRLFPQGLGRSIQKHYAEHGIAVFTQDVPVSFEKKSRRIIVRTKKGREIESDIIIAGIGLVPAVDLAKSAGLSVDNGIVVNEYLESSRPDVYAAGDNTSFMSAPSNRRTRVEHWDNSMAQGKAAGKNMAGANLPYDYIPYFFSDLFEFGFEAAGEIDSRMTTYADWKKENETGIIYYLKDDTVEGVMLCNVWDKIEAAREMIRKREKISAEKLRGAITF